MEKGEVKVSYSNQKDVNEEVGPEERERDKTRIQGLVLHRGDKGDKIMIRSMTCREEGRKIKLS